MKKETHLRNYYEEYLEVCSSIATANKLLEISRLVKKNRPENHLSLPFGTCLIDYSSREYKYISGNCQDIMSYSNAEYIKNGPGFHATEVFHPEDRVVFDSQVFSDIREYWKLIPPKEISEYRFSFNHRYIRKDGTVSQMLQQGSFLEPQAGIPVLHLLVFSDIGDFKADTSIVLTISRLLKDQGYVKVFSKSYLPKRYTPLSIRESEVLRLSLEGYSSKMIAEKLFISIQTVKNHKRNMMEKTCASNIAELISLSLLNSWI
jgi:DNA-binding CsgD family transcriptional regulator